jgi:hypothetical protein
MELGPLTDVLAVGGPSRGEDIKGPLTVNGAEGGDTIDVWGHLATAPVVVDSGAGDDLVSLFDTFAPVTVKAGAGRDTISVGHLGRVASIRGPLHVDGGADYDTVRIDDGSNGPDVWGVDFSTLMRNKVTVLTHSDVERFDIVI